MARFPVHGVVLRVAGLSAAALALTAAPASAADTVITSGGAPLIVQGGACFGAACITPGEVTSPTIALKTTDTPGIRLNQTGTGGFTPQIWDVAGNEANFFVRDLTAGSRLPFRIRPGAPTSSIDIAASGAVGIGTDNPGVRLDVRGTSGTTALRVTENTAAGAPRTLGSFVNNGPVRLAFTDTGAGLTWLAGIADGSGFGFTPTAGSAPVLTLSPTGSLVSTAALQQGADPAGQDGAQDVDPQAVLAALRTLPLQTFSYDGEDASARHMAPSGAAFRAAFGLGASDATIAPGDVAAVALAGVRALAATPPTADARVGTLVSDVAGLSASLARTTSTQSAAAKRITKLEAANRSLSKRLKRLEASVRKLTRARR